jgi:hypothetical protein
MSRFLGRLVDPGAIFAGWVGAAMAVTIAVSFLLVIPIGDAALGMLALPAGLLIGYYADQRADLRGGPWRRLLAGAAYAGLLTGATMALLLLGIKALFFAADDGYRDRGGRLECEPGAACVYARYLADGRGDDLAANGVTDVASFTSFYWSSQLWTAGTILAVTLGGGILGGVAYGLTNRRRPDPTARADERAGGNTPG